MTEKSKAHATHTFVKKAEPKPRRKAAPKAHKDPAVTGGEGVQPGVVENAPVVSTAVPVGMPNPVNEFVNITGGDYKGRVAAIMYVEERDKHGVPTRLLVRTRDADNELVAVSVKDVESAGDYRGGR